MGTKEEAEIAKCMVELAEILDEMDDRADSIFIRLTRLIEQELKINLLPYKGTTRFSN